MHVQEDDKGKGKMVAGSAGRTLSSSLPSLAGEHFH